MPYSVVFCGTPEFAVPSLRALIEHPDFDVELVITQPDRPVGRKQVLTPPPVKVVAEANGIDVWQPENINQEFSEIQEEIDIIPPDFLVVVAYGQLISQAILDLPTKAPVNVHASLLPRWRGAAPIQHAVLTGDNTSGVTIQRMVKQLDAGPILGQSEITLPPRVTSAQLHDVLAEMGAELLIETLLQPLQETAQNEADVTHCGKLDRADGVADPTTMTAEQIDRMVRALSPWPGVSCPILGETVKLIETDIEQNNSSISVACSNGSTLYVSKLQPPNKPSMNAADWQRGKQ